MDSRGSTIIQIWLLIFWTAGFCLDIDFDLGLGYRQDNLRLLDSFQSQSVPERGTLVNATDTHAARNLNILEIEGRSSLTYKKIYLFGEGSYGWILNGRNPAEGKQTLDDVLPGVRTTVFAFTKGPVGGYVWDTSGGIGYRFNCNPIHVSLAPIVGYSYHKQKINQRILKQKSHQEFLILQDTITFSLSGINSPRFYWYGPFVGLHLFYQPSPAFQLFAKYEFNPGWGTLHGQIHLQSLETSDTINPPIVGNEKAWRNIPRRPAIGNVASLGFLYRFASHWNTGLTGNFSYWSLKKGSKMVKDEFSSLINHNVKVIGTIDRFSWESWSLLAFIELNN